MKKMVIVSSLILVVSGCVFSKDKIMVSVVGNYLNPSDSGYRDVYGSSVFFPELKAGYRLCKSVSIWGGYGFFSKKGTTPELEEEAKSTQHFFSFGIAYDGKISEKFAYRAGLGLMNVSYKEEAMDEEVSGSSTGFRIDGEILYGIGSGFFAKISIGYSRASDKVRDVEIKPGGFNAGIGLEARF